MSPGTDTLDPEVAALLNRRHFGFRAPLRVAWRWNRGQQSDELRKAEQLLRALAEKYHDALPVWYELAFNLVKQKRRDETLTLLRRDVEPRLGRVFDVDTLCLMGRCLKDQADEHRSAGRLAAAEEAYAAAEGYYDRAYRLGQDRFPGINGATLRLLRASLLKQFSDLPGAADTQSRDDPQATEIKMAELLASSRARAREVLASRAKWRRLLKDDDIWMAATEAEAYVLLQEWTKAEEKYKAALRPENGPLPHHSDSMEAQLLRLTGAYKRLGEPIPPPLNDPVSFFKTLFPLQPLPGSPS